jgi:hypothetical protein
MLRKLQPHIAPLRKMKSNGRLASNYRRRRCHCFDVFSMIGASVTQNTHGDTVTTAK